MRRLQVAFDLPDTDTVLRIAGKIAEAAERDKLIFEAGTPLIKAAGLSILGRLAEQAPGIPLLADMKTIDAGALEAGLAFRHGATYTTVLALASDETIGGVVSEARRWGRQVVADLMLVRNPVKRAVELSQAGVNVVCYHVPIDVQLSRGVQVERLVELLSGMKARLGGCLLAVAGGVTPASAGVYSQAGADIVVVGRYVYAAQDPLRAVNELLEAIEG